MTARKATRARGGRTARWGIALLAIFVVLGTVSWTVGELFVLGAQDRVLSGVSVAGINAGGKTAEELARALETAVDEWNRVGITLRAGEKTMTITNAVSAVGDLDLTYELMELNASGTVRRALAIGHRSDQFQNILAGFQALTGRVSLPASISVDKAALRSILRENFASLERPAVDAHFILTTDGAAMVVPSQIGSAFDYDKAISAIERAFSRLEHPTVELALAQDVARVGTTDAEALLPEVQRVLAALPRDVVFRDPKGSVLGSAAIDRATVTAWLGAEPMFDGGRRLTLHGLFEQWLDRTVRAFEKEPVDAKFVVVRDRVKDFQESQDGLKLPRAKAAEVLREALLRTPASTDISLELEQVSPAVAIGEANTLGVRELLGFGTSNFKGSPKNRRHNIATGVAKLNGIIVPAGEEFSLVKALGKIEKETGYLPELVIKGNKTIPEYGGGLCQIGTTVFRAAMAAGFPILERQNHSYRVRYYEPAGTDATIYPPRPDFRFLNNTPGPVVLITKVLGDDLRFEFWGTSDGRKAQRTDPKIFNIVKPAATKIIETEDLPVGKKKCTEIAHDGADAVFTYTVTMPDGEKREQVFKSHYKPWQAVCLVGVEPGEKEKEPGEEEDSLSEGGYSPVPAGVEGLPSADAPVVTQ